MTRGRASSTSRGANDFRGASSAQRGTKRATEGVRQRLLEAIVRNEALTMLAAVDGDASGLATDRSGRLIVAPQIIPGNIVTRVAAAIVSTSLVLSNPARFGTALFNESTSIAYVKLGAGASVVSYTVQMAPGAYYEVPFGYSGPVDCIWLAAVGAMQVTEVG